MCWKKWNDYKMDSCVVMAKNQYKICKRSYFIGKFSQKISASELKIKIQEPQRFFSGQSCMLSTCQDLSSNQYLTVLFQVPLAIIPKDPAPQYYLLEYPECSPQDLISKRTSRIKFSCLSISEEKPRPTEHCLEGYYY